LRRRCGRLGASGRRQPAILRLGARHAVVERRTATHRHAGQRAHHGSVFDALAPLLAQGDVLDDLLGDRLRQLFEETLGDCALDHLARDALGRQCGDLAGNLLRVRAAGEHGVDVAQAKALRYAPAQVAEERTGEASRHGGARLAGGE